MPPSSSRILRALGAELQRPRQRVIAEDDFESGLPLAAGEVAAVVVPVILVGVLNLGGSIKMIPNAVSIAELAIDKQAQRLLMPVGARRQLNGLPDDLRTRISKGITVSDH